MHKKSDYYYDLPDRLIAQTPCEPRDNSKLMVCAQGSGKVEHKRFYNVLDYLKKGDVLVINNTKVLPARLFAKTDSGGKVEVLLLKRIRLDEWEVLVKPGKKAKEGARLKISDGLSLEVLSRTDSGGRTVKFFYQGVFEDLIAKVGTMPLPPYIKERLSEQSRYQTVYAKTDGSSAAPTAGLHFTDGLLQRIKDAGVEIAEVLLHVGLGTFRPVKEENILEHKMHTEYYSVSKAAADRINLAKKEGRRVIAVGTTSVRTLESVSDERGFIKPSEGQTGIFIYPPYRFKCVDGIITNFHLPESTLLMLIAAFCGRERILELYALAVENEYRFFSFGDAMMLTHFD